MTPEIDFFLKINNSDWRLGYEEGFNQAKEIMILRLEKALKEIKKDNPFTATTTTISVGSK